MKIITIHGIRRKNKWYETFSKFEEIQANSIEVIHFEYGYLDIIRFLIPSSRRKIINRFQEYYSEKILKDEDSPSAICHSFGTYIFYSAIDKYEVIKFNRVILCGSILNPNTDWVKFFKNNQIRRVFHDYGKHDNVVRFSKLVLGNSAGASGKLGFNFTSKKYREYFTQELNNFEHSSYFLPLHMETKWVPFLLADISKVAYDRRILRQEVIERLFNINGSDIENYTKIEYSARVDVDGNYYANYIKEGVCRQEEKESIEINTSADAMNNFESMSFRSIDQNKKFLSVSLLSEKIHEKKIKLYFSQPLKNSDYFWVKCFFKWKNTMIMDSKGGDTDHYWVGNCEKYTIKINFPRKLLSPSFIAFQDKKSLKKLPLDMHLMKDGTITYITKTEKIPDYDGVIFYYEGIQDKPTIDSLVITQQKEFKSKSGKSYFISLCQDDDIRSVYRIECEIENKNAAKESTLYERLKMYPYGFLVAKNVNGDVVGYLESMVFHDLDFERFSEINDFPLFHDIAGDTLYIIFVAVDKKHRDEYIGLQLIKSAVNLAQKLNLRQVKLVAKDDKIGLYQKCEFKYVKELPVFLSELPSKNILMKYQLA